MILSPAPAAYDRADQTALRESVQRADAANLKRGRDVEVGRGRVILTAPGGQRFALVVADDGELGAVAL